MTNEIITMNRYQDEASKTIIYPQDDPVIEAMYLTLGLVGESGEVAEKVKKAIRDNGGNVHDPKVKEALIKELGDVLWYLSQMAKFLGVTLTEVAVTNLEKLAARKSTQTLTGSGDNR